MSLAAMVSRVSSLGCSGRCRGRASRGRRRPPGGCARRAGCRRRGRDPSAGVVLGEHAADHRAAAVAYAGEDHLGAAGGTRRRSSGGRAGRAAPLARSGCAWGTTTSSAASADVGVEPADEDDGDGAADELGDDEAWHRARGDAGEGVGEHPANGDGGVREGGGRGEPVGGADVGADGGRGEPPRPVRASAKIRATRPAVATTSPSQQVPAGAVLGGQLAERDLEHQVGEHGPGDGADDLCDGVGADVAAGEPGAGAAAEQPVGSRDDRVEVGAGDRAEHQDQHGQSEEGGGGVLQQLQPDVVRRQRSAAMPEPTTTVTRRPVPMNSATEPAGEVGRRGIAVSHRKWGFSFGSVGFAGRRGYRRARASRCARAVRCRRGSGGPSRRRGRRGRRASQSS